MTDAVPGGDPSRCDIVCTRSPRADSDADPVSPPPRGLVVPSRGRRPLARERCLPSSPRIPHASDRLPSLPAHDPQADFKFQDLLDKLPADEPRYLVLDWNVENDDGCQLSKIFFVSWVPDTCKAKTKMLYASSKQALRNALEGVHLDHQATDYDEITPEEFTSRTLGK